MILPYKCTTWTLTKFMEKKLDGNYTRMLRAILNNSWRQQPTKLQLYGHLSPITKTIQVRLSRHVGHCWRSKGELISDILLWTPSHWRARQEDKQEPIYNSSVPIQTYKKPWTKEKGGGRGLGRSMLMLRYDDNYIYIYIYIYADEFMRVLVCVYLPTPGHEQYVTQCQFLSEFFFSKTGWPTKIKEPRLPYYLL